jgi:hypothetical protein
MEKALISRYNNDIKVWTAEVKKIKEDTMVVYSVVLGQMSEASRVECEQGIDLKKKENAKDLVYFINRIQSRLLESRLSCLQLSVSRVSYMSPVMASQKCFSRSHMTLYSFFSFVCIIN